MGFLRCVAPNHQHSRECSMLRDVELSFSIQTPEVSTKCKICILKSGSFGVPRKLNKLFRSMRSRTTSVALEECHLRLYKYGK